MSNKRMSSKFIFRKKPPLPVTEGYDLDLDFVDTLSDCASVDLFDEAGEEITSDNDDIQLVQEVKKDPEPKGSAQKAWGEIMSKMRYQPKEVRAEKQEQAAEQWKGLMGTMRKNQQKTSVSVMKSKSKNSKRQTKKPLTNPHVKRLKSTKNPVNKATSMHNSEVNSQSQEITEIDLELSDLELTENTPKSEERRAEAIVTPKPVCPIFLPRSASTSKKDIRSTLQEIKQKIRQAQASENPWTRQHGDSGYPEVVQLNDFVEVEPTETKDKNKQPKKTCPFYKILPGTKFAVDAFSYGVIPGIDVYFLSHFHSDHYQGLKKKFDKTIICSVPTGNLVAMKIGVAERCLRRLELNKIYIIQGIEIVLIDANHCPGSVMFLLRLPDGTNYLHTGDFRYTSEMFDNQFLNHLRVDCLYLDTTYCDPQYDFPLQCDAISQAVLAVRKHLINRPKTLICVGSYSIGKERVFCALAEVIGSQVYCSDSKRSILNELENPYIQQLLSNNENCRVHVLEMHKFTPTLLSEYLKSQKQTYTNIFGIKPTGWEFSKGAVKSTGSSIRSYFNDTVSIMGIAYSEHSSFSELKEFVSIINPVKVQPTVNVGNAEKREAMMTHIKQWLQNT